MAADLTPERRALLNRIAAHSSWAKTKDRAARTEPAKNAGPQSLPYWERRVDPDGEMDDVTRAKAAENARTAHYQRMAYARWSKRKQNAS